LTNSVLFLGDGNNSVSVGATRFVAPVGEFVLGNTESNNQKKFFIAGSLTKLYIRISAASGGSGNTMITRVNAANGTLSISMAAGTTGDFVDSTNTQSLSVNDLLSYRIVNGGSSLTPRGCTALFDTGGSDTISIQGVNNFSLATFSTASTSRYTPVHGDMTAFDATEATNKCRQKKAGVMKRFGTWLFSNARGTDCTLQGRLNGADGAMTATITHNVTGWFVDSTNTDTIVVGDDYDVELTTGTGTGSIEPDFYVGSFSSTNGDSQASASKTVVRVQNANVTAFYNVGGGVLNQSTENLTFTNVYDTFTADKALINLTANTVSATSTLRLRVAGADGNLTVSITTNTSGIFEDTTHSDSLVSTNSLDWSLVTGATGTSLSIANIAMWLNQGGGGGGVTARPRTLAINMSRYLSMDIGSELSLGVSNQGGISINILAYLSRIWLSISQLGVPIHADANSLLPQTVKLKTAHSFMQFISYVRRISILQHVRNLLTITPAQQVRWRMYIQRLIVT
jgi:hypothetical protein